MSNGIAEMNYRVALGQAGLLLRRDLDLSRISTRYEAAARSRLGSAMASWPDQMPLNMIAAGVYAAGLLSGKDALKTFGAALFVNHMATIALKQAAKLLVDRPRPNVVAGGEAHYIRLPGNADPAYQSFPSGHAAGAAMAARTAATLYPKAAPLAYGLAGIAAILQVPRQGHYVSDILAGAALGLASVAAVAAVRKRIDG